MASIDLPSRSGLTRRSFLQGIAGVLAAGPSLRLLGPEAVAAAFGSSLPTGAPVVVLVELAGGCDVLNMVVPFAVPATTGYYRSARPTIGITRLVTTRPYGPPPNGDYLPPALDLDGAWAVHGALPWLGNRWHTKADVAIVKGTGENVMREMSHFAAMSFRWAGAFGGGLILASGAASARCGWSRHRGGGQPRHAEIPQVGAVIGAHPPILSFAAVAAQAARRRAPPAC